MHFIKLHGMHKAFHNGSNSSCHLHIRQHHEIYKEKCERADIPVSHWAIPWEIWKVMEENKALEEQGWQTNKIKQQTLDFKTVTGPRPFTRSGILHAVAALIATNNQVSFNVYCQHYKADSEHTCSLPPLPVTQHFEMLSLSCSPNPPHQTSQVPMMPRHISTILIVHMKGLKEEIMVSHITLLALERTYSYLNRRLLGRSQ